jgi:hypothetical protein
MMHFRKIVIFAVILSLSVLPVGCSDAPKTEVRVEPPSADEDKQVSEPSERSDNNEAASDSNYQRQPIPESYSSEIDTTYTYIDSVPLDEGSIDENAIDESSEFIGDDTLETAEPSEQEHLSDGFLTDESEIAENRLVSSRVVQVITPDLRDSYDSMLVVIEERLTIRPDPVSDKVVLEKWRSPVNYKGYKFNMRKLMLFGVYVHYPVQVYRYMGHYYFTSGGEFYNLEVFPDFSPFQAVADTSLSRYLSDFEN